MKKIIILIFLLITNYLNASINDCHGPVIVALGDSITQGANVVQTNTYPRLLPNMLNISNVISLNDGVGGDTALAGLIRFKQILIRHSHIDFVIIMFGTNDSWATPSTNNIPPISLGDFSWSLQQIITLAKNRNIIPILATPIPISSTYWTANSFTYNYNSNYWLAQYVQAVKNVGMVENVLVVDLFTILGSGASATWDNLLVDGVHPNNEGYNIIANEIAIKIEENF